LKEGDRLQDLDVNINALGVLMGKLEGRRPFAKCRRKYKCIRSFGGET